MAREVLELQPRERSQRVAEARIVCAITAAGPSLDLDTVQPALAAAVADFVELARGEPSSDPVAAMGEPMLALVDRDRERAFAVFDRYMTSPDPWLRAAVPMLRGTFGKMLGQLDWAESDYQDSLAAFRALGEAWGAASVLIQVAELAQVRADYATTVAALEEAAAFGRELGAWGDLPYIDGMLAAVRLRMGDLPRAHADLERAEHAESERRGRNSDMESWLALVRAELHWRDGDLGAAIGCCTKVLAWLETKQSQWWNGMRAQLQARLALLVLEDGDEPRCRVLLAAALQAAVEWVERPALASALDAIAVLAFHAGEPSAPDEPSGPDASSGRGEPPSHEARSDGSRAGAALAATLLGAAHTIRGVFDAGSLDAPSARDAARGLLGPAEFGAAYERGRGLGRDDALALASGVLADRADAGLPRIGPARSVMQNRLASAGLWGLRERSVQVSGPQPQRVLCLTRTFA